jgi:hypothetical protein
MSLSASTSRPVAHPPKKASSQEATHASQDWQTAFVPSLHSGRQHARPTCSSISADGSLTRSRRAARPTLCSYVWAFIVKFHGNLVGKGGLTSVMECVDLSCSRRSPSR